jgi:hypothetical protein
MKDVMLMVSKMIPKIQLIIAFLSSKKLRCMIRLKTHIGHHLAGTKRYVALVHE